MRSSQLRALVAWQPLPALAVAGSELPPNCLLSPLADLATSRGATSVRTGGGGVSGTGGWVPDPGVKGAAPN
jgi:hypothetical protein